MVIPIIHIILVVFAAAAAAAVLIQEARTVMALAAGRVADITSAVAPARKTPILTTSTAVFHPAPVSALLPVGLPTDGVDDGRQGAEEEGGVVDGGQSQVGNHVGTKIRVGGREKRHR